MQGVFSKSKEGTQVVIKMRDSFMESHGSNFDAKRLLEARGGEWKYDRELPEIGKNYISLVYSPRNNDAHLRSEEIDGQKQFEVSLETLKSFPGIEFAEEQIPKQQTKKRDEL